MEFSVFRGLESFHNYERSLAESGEQTIGPIDFGDADNNVSFSTDEASHVDIFVAALQFI